MKTRAAIVLVLLTITSCTPPTDNNEVMKIYKSANCGCCVGYSQAMQDAGFQVETITTQDMQSVKDKHQIPNGMESCHTAEIDNYFVEGHVPEEAMNKMLNEQPNIDGISLPDMPSGSPGMPGQKRETWQIYEITDGQAQPYMEI